MQNFTNIASSTTLADSLSPLLNNDRTALSCSSGTAFPVTDLQIGQLCFRTDQSKLYQLVDATPTWVLLLDLTGGSAKVLNATNATSATNASQLNGQAASFYTDIIARLGYTPANKAGDTFGGDVSIQGNTTLGDASTDSVTVNGATFTYIATGTRIKGDFSNATLASRMMFQSSGTNQQTSVGILPSGTATNSSLILYAGSAPDNATLGFIQQTEALLVIAASKSGTGAFTPMSFYTGGTERSKIGVTGEQLWSYQGYFGEATLTDGATIAWDVNLAQVAKVTLGGSRTMGAPTNQKAGAFYALNIIQSSGGGNTVAWNSVYKFPSGTAPIITTTANARDYFVFRSDGTNMYLVGKTQDVR